MIFGGGGEDTLLGGGGRDTIFGGSENDVIRGNSGHDLIDGGDGKDFLLGGVGDDTLLGQNGDDTLDGRGDRDVLNGGGGADLLSGGGAADTFIFQDGWGKDTITDFNANDEEDIDLSAVSGITDFADLLANHLRDNGGSAEIFDGADTILLQGVSVSTIGAGQLYSEDDFLF